MYYFREAYSDLLQVIFYYLHVISSFYILLVISNAKLKIKCLQWTLSRLALYCVRLTEIKAAS